MSDAGKLALIGLTAILSPLKADPPNAPGSRYDQPSACLEAPLKHRAEALCRQLPATDSDTAASPQFRALLLGPDSRPGIKGPAFASWLFSVSRRAC